MSDNTDNEELRRQQRAARRAQMKREKERMERINRLIRIGALPSAGILCLIIVIIVMSVSSHRKSDLQDKQAERQSIGVENSATDETFANVPDNDLNETGLETSENIVASSAASSNVTNPPPTAMPYATAQAVDGRIKVGDLEFLAENEAKVSSLTKSSVTDKVKSSHAILINPSTNDIVVQRDADTRIYPASMTKVLTLLVAAEHITDLDDEFTITIDITDYAYQNDCSAVGFLDDETVTVRDLLYGTILPSGGDAALGLAVYVAGSQEAFVEMMNDKLKELGLSDTAHFTNCIGIHDNDHYCTTYDMAIIMKAAVENDLCREVLSAHTYTTSSTGQHPDGITISNWFLRRIEDKDSGGLVVGGKTGFVNQSGSCAVSYFVSNSGEPYICATADTYSSWRCIYDHVDIYKTYTQ